MHPFSESTMARAQMMIAKGLEKLDEASQHWRRDDESIRLRNEAMGAARYCFEQAQHSLDAAAELEKSADAAE